MNLTSKAKAFWIDDRGFIISAELVIIATVLVLGLIVGLSSVQNAIVSELFDVSRAFCNLNQTYLIRGFRGCKSFTGTSGFFWSNNCGVCAAAGISDFGGGMDGIGIGGGIGGGFSGGMGGSGAIYGGSSSGMIVAPSVTSTPSSSVVVPSVPQSTPESCPPSASTTPCQQDCLPAPGAAPKGVTPVTPKMSVEPAPMMAPGPSKK